MAEWSNLFHFSLVNARHLAIVASFINVFDFLLDLRAWPENGAKTKDGIRQLLLKQCSSHL
jgi:hypothetical protein